MVVDEIRSRVVEVRKMRLGDIAGNPRNPKKHPDAQRAALRGAVQELGFGTVPVAYVSNRLGGKLAFGDGHLRGDEFAELVTDVAITDYTDEEIDKFLLYADPIAAMAQYEATKLDALLRDVQTGDAALRAMLAGLAQGAGLYPDKTPVADPGAQIDKADELRQKWGVELGDLWALGEHRLICGDCTDKAVVERVMGGERAGAVVTDPPYGIGADKKKAHSSIRDNPAWADVAWDKRPEDIHIEYMANFCDHVAIWGGNYFANILPVSSGWLAWIKPQAGTDFSLADMELCWTNLNIGARCKEFNRRDGHDHPTQKPVDLIVWTIEKIGHKKNETVTDFYLGSGTTLIACEQLGRKCRAVEISPAYVAVALERWSVATGHQPERIT